MIVVNSCNDEYYYSWLKKEKYVLDFYHSLLISIIKLKFYEVLGMFY